MPKLVKVAGWLNLCFNKTSGLHLRLLVNKLASKTNCHQVTLRLSPEYFWSVPIKWPQSDSWVPSKWLKLSWKWSQSTPKGTSNVQSMWPQRTLKWISADPRSEPKVILSTPRVTQKVIPEHFQNYPKVTARVPPMWPQSNFKVNFKLDLCWTGNKRDRA